MKKIFKGSRRRQESGQVEVETAIILPLVVFLVLGLIQLGLLHQARLFAKYAAYRAVRYGSLRVEDGWKDNMAVAALAACLPIVSKADGNAEVIFDTSDAEKWINKWYMRGFAANLMADVFMPYTEVVICGPTQDQVSGTTYEVNGTEYVPFDLPDPASDGIRTKLRIQLTLNYRMIIPFADWVIYRMTRGWQMVKEMRLGEGSPLGGGGGDWAKYDAAAMGAKVFIIPIRVQYSMKMHSDVPLDYLPDSSECM